MPPADVAERVLGVMATAAGRDTQTPVETGDSPALTRSTATTAATRPADRPRRDATGGRRPGGGRPSRGRWLLDLPAAPEPPRRDRRALLTRLAVVSIVLGLVTALISLPLVAGLGLFAKSTADHYMSLPSVLATPPLPTNSEILASDGSVIATLHGAENRVVVSGDHIPKIMREAIVAIEDSRFYQHGGFDPKGVLRAALRNSQAGDVQQGASTLTQQYVKNVLLQNATTAAERQAAVGTSITRKIQELRYATALEKKLSKDEILTRYLNIAYFGDGAYGVGTAAQHYFNVDVSQLTLDQAALLAGLVQSPSNYNPTLHPVAARARRDAVLDRMVASNYITQTQAEAGEQVPITLHIGTGSSVDSCTESATPFFCDYVRTQLSNDPALGATPEERQNRIYAGGLVIHTTLDPTVQQAAQNAVDTIMGPTNQFAGIEVVVQPGTGNILAMAANQRYGSDASQHQTKINLPTTPIFQPGSTMKLFTMLAALERGYGLSTAFYSPPCYSSSTFPMAVRQNTPDCPQGYQNSDPAEAGVYDMSSGTWKSVNTYYVQLEEKVGVMAVANMAERLGVPRSDLPAGLGPTLGGLTIGQETRVSPLTMANAYATIADGGLLCTPRFVTSATDTLNENVDIAPKPSCTRVLTQGISDTASSVLEGVVTQGTGYPNAVIGRPAAGKTGTNDDYAGAWFDGFVPQMAAAVAVGNPSASMAPLKGVVADGQTWPRVFGGDLPAMIWGSTFKQALRDQPVLPLPPADPTVAQGTQGGLMNTTPPPTASPGVMINPLTGQPIGVGPSGKASLTPSAAGSTKGLGLLGFGNGNGNGNGNR
jgi:membrane peptidoglycan carboxypeptidase